MKCETDDYRTDLDLVSPHALAPLTLIQVNACYSIVGLPEAETALLTGSVASRKRQNIWATKRIIYCTPQVLPAKPCCGDSPRPKTSSHDFGFFI